MCRPIHKFGTFVLIIGMLLAIIGLVIGLFDKGWLSLLIGIGCSVFGIILGNIPKIYLTSFIKLYDDSLTAKQATKIVENHLTDPNKKDTVYFLADFDDEQQKKKKQQNIM